MHHIRVEIDMFFVSYLVVLFWVKVPPCQMHSLAGSMTLEASIARLGMPLRINTTFDHDPLLLLLLLLSVL